MVMSLHASLLAAYRHCAGICGLIIILISTLVLIGWQFDIAVFKSGLPGLTAMNPGGTALSFILAGTALLIFLRQDATSRMIRAGRTCGALIVLIAALILHGQIFGWDHGPDKWLFYEKLKLEAQTLGHINRMAPNTAVAFLLAGLALFLIDVKIRRIWPAQLLAVGGILIALLSIIGYGYSMLALAGVREFIPMALNTAFCFALLNIGILFARPDRGLVALFSSEGSGGMLARRLVPAVIIVPAALGALYEIGQQTGVISPTIALALYTFTSIVLLTVLSLFAANSLQRTDRKRQIAEEELEKSRTEAERANQAKSEFLANMSHELRTPMNSVLGLTLLLYEEDDLAEEHREMIGIVYRSADNLLDILNDILDLSKIEARELHLESIPFSLPEIVNNVIDTMLPLSSEAGIGLTSHIHPNNPPYLRGDPLRVSRIMMNLVSNAVKYTDSGFASLEVEIVPIDDDHVEMHGKVTDTGIGIPQEKFESIFEKFSQVDDSHTRNYGGTGLGLNITKQLIEMMGGSMHVESTVGEGSVFSFRIPFPTAEERPMIAKRAISRDYTDNLPDSQRKPISDVKILLAEDHLLNQSFIRKLFKRIGIKNFDIVDNGQEAWNTLNQKDDYDLVITDCHMPVMSGYDLSEKIRESGKTLPIVAITADAMLGTRERCINAGMNDYIAKPINPDEFKMVLERWFIFPEKKAGTRPHGRTDRKKPEPPAINLDILKQYADTPEELKEFIDEFLAQAEQSIKNLKENCVEGESKKWVGAAHKLKGGAGMIKAEKLHILCEEAQSMETTTINARKDIYGKIKAAFDDVKESLALVTAKT